MFCLPGDLSDPVHCLFGHNEVAWNDDGYRILAYGMGYGNSWENQVQFQFEGLNAIKPEMIEDATKNAREAAEKFAKDSDSRLGKIKTASQGTFTISDRDSNTPYIKKVRVVSSVTYYLKH